MDIYTLMTALSDLDKPTLAYFRSEMFAHGDLTVPRNAQLALERLDPDDNSVSILRKQLRVVPADEPADDSE